MATPKRVYRMSRQFFTRPESNERTNVTGNETKPLVYKKHARTTPNQSHPKAGDIPRSIRYYTMKDLDAGEVRFSRDIRMEMQR